jgi:fatty-acyl-CoA synthase
MKGYFEDPGATAEALDRQGWLHTGDLGSMDAQGYLRIQGLRGGENIYPREIEDVLFAHPGIANVAVVGIPDREWGEVVAAFVKARPGYELDETELTNFCGHRLAAYKVPRLWRFVAEFPQTSSGKIQKFMLRNQIMGM